MKFRKIAGIVVAVGLATFNMATIASAEADGLSVVFGDDAHLLGYTVKGYYCDSSGNNMTAVTGQLNEDGSFYFPGKQGDVNYSNFYVEVYDPTGKLVKEKALAYIGDLKYASDVPELEIEADLSYNELSNIVMLQSGQSLEDLYVEEEIESSITDSITSEVKPIEKPKEDDVTLEDSWASLDEDTSHITEDVATTGLSATVSGEKGVDLNALLPDVSISVYVTNSAKKTTQYNIGSLAKSFVLNKDLAEGEYTIKYATEDIGISKVSGNKSVTIGSSVDTLDIAITPSCVLYVSKTVNGENTSANYTIQGYNIKRNTTDGYVVAVVPGAKYTVIDMDAKTSFNITIPSTAKKCALDLGSVTGTPINPDAFDSNGGGKIENPYDIPETGDITPNIAEIFMMSGVLSGGIGSGYYFKKKRK